jgi:hypothetical protein
MAWPELRAKSWGVIMKSTALRTRLLPTDGLVPPDRDGFHKSILILGKRTAPVAKVRVR